MPVFNTFQKLGNGWKYETFANIRMSEKDSSESNPFKSAHQSNTDTDSETRILTQGEVDDQIRNYIAPLTRQLEKLIRLIQEMSTAHRPNRSPKAGTSANFSAAGPSPNNAFWGSNHKAFLMQHCFFFKKNEAHSYPATTNIFVNFERPESFSPEK